MGVIGDLWSIPNTFISAGMASNASSKAYARQLDYMYRSAQTNYNFQQKSLRESPSAQREGLETAGYNPMLAVQNATGGANANFANSTGVNMDEIAGITTANATSAQAFNSMENLDKQTESNVKLQESSTFKNRMEALSQQIKNQFLSSRERAEINKTNAESTKLQSDTALNSATIENLKSRLELDRALGFAGLDVQRRGQNLSYNATTYSADKSYEASKYNTDNNMIKAGVAGVAGALGLMYGPAKLKALRLLGKTKAVGF